jgi:short-subunit dehydrogenase
MTKTVIITGGSRGIGAACAFEFATEKYNITLVGRNSEKLDKVAIECEKKGASGVLVIAQDLSKTSELFTIIDRTVKLFGQINVLINNAGTMKPGGLEDQTEENFDFVMAVNCKERFNTYI